MVPRPAYSWELWNPAEPPEVMCFLQCSLEELRETASETVLPVLCLVLTPAALELLPLHTHS